MTVILSRYIRISVLLSSLAATRSARLVPAEIIHSEMGPGVVHSGTGFYRSCPFVTVSLALLTDLSLVVRGGHATVCVWGRPNEDRGTGGVGVGGTDGATRGGVRRNGWAFWKSEV